MDHVQARRGNRSLYAGISIGGGVHGAEHLPLGSITVSLYGTLASDSATTENPSGRGTAEVLRSDWPLARALVLVEVVPDRQTPGCSKVLFSRRSIHVGSAVDVAAVERVSALADDVEKLGETRRSRVH